MRKVTTLLLCLFILILGSCNSNPEKKASFRYEQQKSSEKASENESGKALDEEVKPSEITDLSTKGIGPVRSLEISSTINREMAREGEQLFKSTCLACHLPEKGMIGPGMKGITQRRTPEWIVNMILNPQEMALKDSLANALLKEYNQSIMPNQNITEKEARAMLEYFRTLSE